MSTKTKYERTIPNGQVPLARKLLVAVPASVITGDYDPSVTTLELDQTVLAGVDIIVKDNVVSIKPKATAQVYALGIVI